MSEGNKVNLFSEARLEAGLSIEKAAMVISDPGCNHITITHVESVPYPYPMPIWAHKYLAMLRTIAFENKRLCA